MDAVYLGAFIGGIIFTYIGIALIQWLVEWIANKITYLNQYKQAKVWGALAVATWCMLWQNIHYPCGSDGVCGASYPFASTALALIIEVIYLVRRERKVN